MNLSKAGKRLRREIKAHPQKTAVLGLLFLVALWFWVPLVWGWMEKDARASRAPADGPAADSAADPSPAGQAQSGSARNESVNPKYPWHDLARWIDNDPRTSAASPVLNRRDPFVDSQGETSEAERIEESKPLLAEATPEGLGMVLSGTVVGPDRRVAQINGRSYRQGETVKLVEDGRKTEFTLTAVYSRRIVLEREGKQFELSIPVADHSGRIELSRGGD